MGASYYISSDQEQVGPWPFTGDQVKQCVTRHWPDAVVSGAFEHFLEIQAQLEPGRPTELSYNLRHHAFSFEDRAPLSAPLTVIYTVLHELAPTTPVMWWVDYDAELQPLDLSRGLDAFIEDFSA
ncbi:hypothetical protein [Kitasatospora sp. NBC_01300]|uniref:hypothetical protein n=1 Tax=Kitasatospora sp. NBC_01300 TaxID=2903574 RepID=UPI002F917CF7|nr:hypothetical protein OG556_39665 [Kitasatospora sp. NBC_01300]